MKPDSLIKRRGTAANKEGEGTTETMGGDTKGIQEDSESVPFNKEDSKQQTETKIKSGME